MPGHVGDADHGKTARRRCRLRVQGADQQAAGEAGPAGDRHRVDAVPATRQRRQRAVDHRRDGLEVESGRQVGDDPAVGGVAVDLRADHRAEHLAPVAEHRGGGLVARGLDGEEVQGRYRSG